MGRNDIKFTIGKYYINTMEIIKLFRVNMPATKFSCLTIWIFCKRRPFQIFSQIRGLFKETSGNKIGDFALRKKGREKRRMVRRAQ